MFLLIDWLRENMETIQLSLSLMTMLAGKEGKNPSASGSGLLTCTRFLNKQSLFNALSIFTCPLSSFLFSWLVWFGLGPCTDNLEIKEIFGSSCAQSEDLTLERSRCSNTSLFSVYYLKLSPSTVYTLSISPFEST